MNNAARIIFTTSAGLVFLGGILLIARRGMLSMRYTLGWLFVGFVIVIGGLFSGLIDPVADAMGVEPVALVLASATFGLLGLTVQLSISVSGLTEIVRTLTESHALLEERVSSARTNSDNIDQYPARSILDPADRIDVR
jgi:hypothetical protein